jgi:hypothetical protein
LPLAVDAAEERLNGERRRAAPVVEILAAPIEPVAVRAAPAH